MPNAYGAGGGEKIFGYASVHCWRRNSNVVNVDLVEKPKVHRYFQM